MALVGLKLFLAIAGGSSGANEKSDNPIEVGIIGVNIFALLNQLYFLHALNAYILSRIFFHHILFVFSLQPVMGAVIQALTGSTNRDEVNVMAKQATEVASLVISLAQALATSMSQRRSFPVDYDYAAYYGDYEK